MDKRDLKLAMRVTIADFLISLPYIVALHVAIFGSTELSYNVVKLWGHYWLFVHYPIEDIIAGLFYSNVSDGGHVSLWNALTYFSSCFAQTFLVALLTIIVLRKIHKQIGGGNNE